jgi:hypothetical protein
MRLSFERTLEEGAHAARLALAQGSFGWIRLIPIALFATLGAALTEKLAGPRGADTGLPTAALIAIGACAGIAFSLLLMSRRRGLDHFLPVLIEELGPWPRPEVWTVSEAGWSLKVYDSLHFLPWIHLRAVRRTQQGLVLEWKSAGQSYLPNRLVSEALLAAIPVRVESD